MQLDWSLSTWLWVHGTLTLKSCRALTLLMQDLAHKTYAVILSLLIFAANFMLPINYELGFQIRECNLSGVRGIFQFCDGVGCFTINIR